MVNLIYTHYWGDESCSGCRNICFTAPSKEEFLFNIFEKYKDFNWEIVEDRWGSYSKKIEIFGGIWLDYWEYEHLEHDIFILEDWFNKNKIN